VKIVDYNEERDKQFEAVVEAGKKTYVQKNRDYDNSIDLTYAVLEMLGYPGELSYVVRSLDKVFRVASLARKSEDERLVKNESMLDTLEDEGVYSFAMKRLLENKNEIGLETFVVNLLKEGAEKRRDRTK
jgi:hypothetical protein